MLGYPIMNTVSNRLIDILKYCGNVPPRAKSLNALCALYGYACVSVKAMLYIAFSPVVHACWLTGKYY